MSFTSNVGKQWVEVGPDQCEMIDSHHPDCECASCKMDAEPQCLELVVGVQRDCGDQVCSSCAVQAERGGYVVSYRDEVRFVVVHPEMGVYLGNALGLGFWSKLDPVGQESAVTFASRAEADQFMAQWDNGRPDEAVIWPVVPDVGDHGRPATYASVAACVSAGLDAWTPS